MNYIVYITICYLVFFSLYHYFIYTGRKKEKNILHFANILMILTLPLLCKGVINKYFNNEDVVHLLSMSSYYISGIYMAIFSNVIFGSKMLDKKIIVFSILSLTNVLFFYLLFFTNKNYWIAIYLTSPLIIYSSIIVFLIIKSFIKSKFYKDRWRLDILIGTTIYVFCFLTAAALTMISKNSFQEVSLLLLSIGSIFISLFSAFGFARKFNEEYCELDLLKNDLENQVKNRTKELAISNEQKTTAFINLAHEIKTPLTVLNIGINNYIKKVGNNPCLQDIKYAGDILLKHCVNFLDAEKLQRGQVFYDHDLNVNISELIISKIIAYKQLAQNRNIIISHEIESDINIKADPYAIDRIVNNLIDNAIKYNKPSGSITIKLRKISDKAEFIVYDTGLGISEEHQENIFLQYYQVSHKKRNLQGIGMGLYITSEIVKSINGTISVKSKKDLETEFKIIIPIHKDLSQENCNLLSVISTPTDQLVYNKIEDSLRIVDGNTLLIVEDNLILLKSLRDSLCKNWNIICATNGREALEKCTKSLIKPDVIISDIMMDEMDGYEFLVKIRSYEAFKNIPFIFLTAKTTEIENVTGLELGAIDYIYKPFSMTILSAKVSTILEFLAFKNKLFESERFRTIGMLAASISHEIMNPLSGIKGPLFIIERNAIEAGINDDVFFEGINHIKNNVNRIDNIVNTMRSLFHGRSYSFENLNLLSIVTPIIDIFSDKNKDRIKFKVIIPKDITIISNQGAFTQIIMNLISNAVESINGPGEVIIESQQSDFKCLKIRDSGCGISNEIMNKIFDVAFTTKRENGGTGLGLYIVKELSNRLNITVLIESEMKSGTTVILQFNDSSLESHILVN